MKRFALAFLLALLPSAAFGQATYWGNFPDGGTLNFYTNTVGSDGVAETIASETIAVYKDGSDTELTTGATIDDDIDSRTGLHRIAIDTTQTGFTAGSLYTVVYTAGTVDSVSVAGRVIGSFYLGPKDANVEQFGGTAGLFAAGVPGVNVSQLSSDTTAADNAESFFDGTGYAGTNNVIPLVTTTTNLTTASTGSITAASIAADAITSSEIADGAIDAGALATDTITAAKIAADAIAASEIATDAIGAAELAADAIGASELATDAIGASELAASSITSSEIADASIDAATFAAGAIDATAIASDAIGAAELATDAIGAGEIAADAIGASELATDAIGAAEVAASALAKGTEITGFTDLDAAAVRNAVGLASANLDTQLAALPTSGELADETDIAEAMFTYDATATYGTANAGSVVKQIADNAGGTGLTEAGIADAVLDEVMSGHTTAGTLGKYVADILDDTGTSGVQIPSGEIVAATFGAGAIDATAIAANAITSSEIADGAIDAGALASDAITDAKVASDVTIASVTGAVGSVTGNVGGSVASVATGGITAASIAADAITSSEVADGAIDAGALATDTITAAKIAADAITSSEVGADAIGASEVAAGAWQELIELLFTFDATANYASADAGSVVKQVADNASGGGGGGGGMTSEEHNWLEAVYGWVETIFGKLPPGKIAGAQAK